MNYKIMKFLLRFKWIRMRIYKRVLKVLNNKREPDYKKCFCWILSEVLPIYLLNAEISDFPELMKHKPTKMYLYSCFWFDRNEEGTGERIRIIEEILNKK